MTNYVLEADHLGERYGKHWALRDCCLQLPAGRVVGLVGPNGAGKTTLLHLAMGLLQPAAGSIRILGYSPQTHTREILARVGFVAQNRPLYTYLTVAKHVMLGEKLNTYWDTNTVLKRLEQYDIPLQRKIGQLSGGQQAQVSLALALGKCPELLLLDEPLANLDPLARREFLKTLLVAATEGGITVIFSSHVVSELERFCDYLILLTNGQVRLSGDLDQLLASHKRFSGHSFGIDPLNQVADIVALDRTGHDVSLLVRTETNFSQIGFEERRVTLEELVLAYMTKVEDEDLASMLMHIREEQKQ